MSDPLWPRVAALPLTIESQEVELLGEQPGRVTALVRIRGAGHEGLGEDVGIQGPGGELLGTGPVLPLAGEWTLQSFVEHLATLEQWPDGPPQWEMARAWRAWSYESAALDLALRQAQTTLGEVVGRAPEPVTFVNSLGLGDQPSVDTIHTRVARNPSVRFKLDAQPTWDADLLGALAATGAVDTIDFKGRYGFEVADPDALGELYDRVLAAFPDTVTLEDPHEGPEVTERLRPHEHRVAYDAPVHRVADVAAQPLRPGSVNVKPCRIGSLPALFELYAHAEREGLRLYGGGMGELGPARRQIQELAALFHPGTPNDVAPPPYNAPDPPAGLPASPLTVPTLPGFGAEA